MNNQAVFQRYEMKYLITEAQYARLKEKICRYMIDDRYGQSSICNLYFDTPSFLLIRRSIERPVYKEKLRLRSYGVAVPDSTVFIEMKKKYRSVVYKRRINTTEQEAMRYLCGGKQLADTQIAHELDYFLGQYGFPRPTVFLSYERQAFFAKDDSDFRITFDKNILWRNYDLSLCAGIYGQPILHNGQILMEIKTAKAIPLWMTALLSENHIFKTSFSKYGNAYKTIFSAELKGERYNA